MAFDTFYLFHLKSPLFPYFCVSILSILSSVSFMSSSSSCPHSFFSLTTAVEAYSVVQPEFLTRLVYWTNTYIGHLLCAGVILGYGNTVSTCFPCGAYVLVGHLVRGPGLYFPLVIKHLTQGNALHSDTLGASQTLSKLSVLFLFSFLSQPRLES